MNSSPESGNDDVRSGPELSVVVGERRHLINLAYRLLGSLADAEDAVQETYTRWYAMSRKQQEAIESPGAWLTTVAGRVCLDVLGSARARRERYVGTWIPEPLPDRSEWVVGRADDYGTEAGGGGAPGPPPPPPDPPQDGEPGGQGERGGGDKKK
ncbi:sigma factor, partial [Streptomyces goshikiensis]|uniref:sigma factor n=1 Tax=Streptomyces goshikiensis TaxID=1942 RepID=UPI0036546110